MGKRKTFEALLNTEFRWPKTDDMPFVEAEDPFENAVVAKDSFTRTVLMMEGYKKAADLMVVEASNDRSTRDFLVFPIIFNYRQFLELNLKYLIAQYGRAVDVPATWKSHDLAFLWAEFSMILERYGTSDPDEVDPVVGNIIIEFAKIDPRSFSYRYPVDRNGAPVPVAVQHLHLPVLADVIQGVAGYFAGTDGYLHSLCNA